MLTYVVAFPKGGNMTHENVAAFHALFEESWLKVASLTQGLSEATEWARGFTLELFRRPDNKLWAVSFVAGAHRAVIVEEGDVAGWDQYWIAFGNMAKDQADPFWGYKVDENPPIIAGVELADD